MTYDFFADKEAKLRILEFIFNDTDLRIFDLSSLYGQEIYEYKSVDEIASKFDIIRGDKFALTFQLWTPRHKGEVLFRKIDLDPKYCNGHTFRYATDGWGLIQLYFGGIKNREQHPSHVGHFDQDVALKWENTNIFRGKVGNWDWEEIQTTSRKLKYQIGKQLANK